MNRFLDFWYDYKTKIITFSLFFVFCVLIFWGVYFFNTMKAKADSIENNVVLDNMDSSDESSNKGKITNTIKSNIKVDIKGYVKKPGVYELSNDSRIIDVIDVAGGLKEGADTSSINLSKRIFDEMVVIIYSKDEVKNIEETRKKEEQKVNSCESNESKINNDACINMDNNKNTSNASNNTNQNSLKININTASLDELEKLSGVGESKARSIIEYRSENGPFKTIDEIVNVKGIGDALFEKIKNNITI